MTGDDNGRVIRILVRFYESIQKKKKNDIIVFQTGIFGCAVFSNICWKRRDDDDPFREG